MIGSVDILGTKVSNVSTKEVIEIADKIISQKNRKIQFIFTPNVDHLIMLTKDKKFREAYNSAALRVADGMPLILASYLLGKKLKQRVVGANLVYDLCALAERKNYSVFFLGGKGDVEKKADYNLKKRFPKLKINYFSPSFNIDKKENQEIVKKINFKKPDILFVGLGAPKQERWLYYNRNELKAKMGFGIGGSFEFVAGNIKRAPKFMQNLGLEWIFRLIQEPKRLWKRYLRDLKFPALIAKQAIGI